MIIQAVAVAVLSVAGAWAAPSAHEVGAITFSSEVPLSAPEALGPGAFGLQHPPGVPYAEVKAELIVVTFPAAAIVDGVDWQAAARGSFLGITQEPTGQVERNLLGRPSKGSLYQTTIPRASTVEVHPLSLPDGGRVMLALRAFEGFPEARRDALLGELGTSLTVTKDKE